MDPLFKSAKRHLGQNFLVDDAVRARILQIVDLHADEAALEIGPGLGSLTALLVKTGALVYAVEKDAALIPRLRETVNSPQLRLIESDFLRFDLRQIPRIDKIVGNIPYNISTPIIEKLINSRGCRDIFLTVQLEFARRLAAVPGTKDYGALTCFVQYYYDVQTHFHIYPQSFRPIPKTTSSFIQLSLVERSADDRAQDEAALFQITRAAFRQRRKTLLNALAPLMPKEMLRGVFSDLGIDGNGRAENLAVSDYIRLTNMMAERSKTPPIRRTSV